MYNIHCKLTGPSDGLGANAHDALHVHAVYP